MASTPVAPVRLKHNGRIEWGTWWFDDGRVRRWKYFGSADELSHRQARARYAAWLAEWNTSDRVRNPRATPATYACADLAVDFLTHARQTFVKNGRPTLHVTEIAYGVQALVDAFGDEPAAAVTAPRLARLRDAMVFGERTVAGPDGKPAVERYPRTIRTVNGRLAAIKAAFRWARERGNVSAETLLDVLSVRQLTRRCADAKPAARVLPVEEHHVAAAKAEMPTVVAAMVELQWLTGMRPGEVCAMRACDIDTTGPLWVYRPVGHKLEHLEADRFVVLGKRAQEVARQFMAGRATDAPMFSPREAHAERLEKKRAARKTKLWPSHARKHRVNPTGGLADAYTTETYRRAIAYACRRAAVPAWAPNRLRHAWATTVRKHFGIEAASAGLGHASIDTTLIYAERSMEAAMRVARKIG